MIGFRRGCLLVVLFAIARCAAAAEFPLAWQEDGFSLSFQHDPSRQEVLFKKEPAYQGQRVLRGALPLGAAAGGPMAYAVDWTRKALFLDLNRNLDLTDDEPFVADAQGGSVCMFKRILLAGPGGEGARYLVSLRFFGFTDRVNVDVHSGWMGNLSWGEWTGRVAVVDNLDGRWDGSDQWLLKPSYVESGGAQPPWAVRPFQRLFLGGRAAEVSLTSEGTDWTFALRESSPPMGRMDLEGERIERLVLVEDEGGSRRVAVMERPATGFHELPAGLYTRQHVVLQVGTGLCVAARNAPLRIAAGDSIALAIGAPLNNSLTVRRSGRSLRMSHEVLGRGGESYPAEWFGSREKGRRPRVSIWKGDRHLTSGQFEYG